MGANTLVHGGVQGSMICYFSDYFEHRAMGVQTTLTG
jgi:hypothetical protein